MIGETFEITPFNIDTYNPRKGKVGEFSGPAREGEYVYHGIAPAYSGFLTTIILFRSDGDILSFGINDQEHNGEFTVGNYGTR